MGGLRLLVTGAGGFLGRETAVAARTAGHRVISVVRCDATGGSDELVCDLSHPVAAARLIPVLAEVDVVIHTAAGRGGNAEHWRDTVGATSTLLLALAGVSADKRPRLVHVSSLSVYGYASLPDGALLDELTPAEPEPDRRDAYCRAKLAQEALVRDAVRTHGLLARVLRPGVIYGLGRQWTARLGIKLAGIALNLGSSTRLPLIHVEDAANALVRAAEAPLGRNDLDGACTRGHLEVINLVGDDQPTQAEYLENLRAAGLVRCVLPVPRRVPEICAKMFGLAGVMAPGLSARLPGLLRTEILAARVKPLRYSTARLRDRLGPLATHAEASDEHADA